MIGDILQPTHLLFVLVIALLVLGPKRLPEVGRALGRGLRDFRNAINTDELRDQMISPTSSPSQPPVQQTSRVQQAPPVEQAPAEPAATPVAGEAAHAPTVVDSASPAAPTEGPASIDGETIAPPEPAASTPTAERVP